MININLIKIAPEQNKILVDVSTTLGNKFTRVFLWESSGYKDYAKAVDITNLLSQTSNTESFEVLADVLNREYFTGIFIFEFTTNETENNIKEGVVANLIEYYECLINKILKLDIKGCKVTYIDECGGCTLQSLLSISTLINSLKIALQLGYYREANMILLKLEEMCEICSNCPKLGGTASTQDIVYTFNNSVNIV